MAQGFHSLRSLKNVLQVNPNTVRQNGVDHLFLNPYAGPMAARLLSLEWSATGVRYPTLGEFGSVKNLWFWMTTSGHPDELRTMDSREINWIQKLTVSQTDKTPLYRKGEDICNFRAIILVGKFLQMRRMKNFPLLTEQQEKMPWMIYRTESVGHLRSLTRYSDWYCKAMKAVYFLLKKESTENVDVVANGDLDQAVYDINSLDNNESAYPYTADLLATIVPEPLPVVVAPKEPREANKPSKKKKKWKKTNQESLIEAMAENSEETTQEPNPDAGPVISSADAAEDVVSPQNLADEPSTVPELEVAGVSANDNL